MAQTATTQAPIKAELQEIPYPPAPWKMSGQLWAGIFQTDKPVPLPAGLTPLASGHALIMLVRYLEGTLTYDEIAVGALARRGLRMGIWVDHIWVDSLASVWGGRRIWGLPKDMAEFSWTENRVTITDVQGAIATLSVNLQPSKLPALWMPAPGFGLIEEQMVYTLASVWAHPGKAELCVEAWSPRFGYQFTRPTPRFAFTAKPFRMTVPQSSPLP